MFLLQFQSFTVVVTMKIGYVMKYNEICKKHRNIFGLCSHKKVGEVQTPNPPVFPALV